MRAAREERRKALTYRPQKLEVFRAAQPACRHESKTSSWPVGVRPTGAGRPERRRPPGSSPRKGEAGGQCPQVLPGALSFLPSRRNAGPGGASTASKPSCLERTPLVPALLPPQGYWLVPGTEPVPGLLHPSFRGLSSPLSWLMGSPKHWLFDPQGPFGRQAAAGVGAKGEGDGGAHLGAPGRAGGWGAKSAPRRARASSPGCSSGEIEEGSGVSPALEGRAPA